MNDNYNSMTLDQLEDALSEKKELLEEVLEEKKFWLCNTTVHVPGKKVRQYDAEIKAITETIEKIVGELRKRKVDLPI